MFPIIGFSAHRSWSCLIYFKVDPKLTTTLSSFLPYLSCLYTPSAANVMLREDLYIHNVVKQDVDNTFTSSCVVGVNHLSVGGLPCLSTVVCFSSWKTLSRHYVKRKVLHRFVRLTINVTDDE